MSMNSYPTAFIPAVNDGVFCRMIDNITVVLSQFFGRAMPFLGNLESVRIERHPALPPPNHTLGDEFDEEYVTERYDSD